MLRVFVTRKPQIQDVGSASILSELQSLSREKGIAVVEGVKIVIRYDVQIDQKLSKSEVEKICNILAEKAQDDYFFDFECSAEERILAIESIPGQFDQRADSARQCITMLFENADVIVRVAKYIVLKGNISDEAFKKICNYCINPVESQIASLEIPTSLIQKVNVPESVETIKGFTSLTKSELQILHGKLGLAMSFNDLFLCYDYFKDTEKRDPTITEIRVIDTYWSDHCRHTTFNTRFEGVDFGKGVPKVITAAYEEYLKNRNNEKPVCLMDLALSAMKRLKSQGKLTEIFETQENNACSIVVPVKLDSGEVVEYVVMFKNETHNHPTEIEPFGGAATCLGGAIRDPLSGRTYVYQAMRITGSGNPNTPIEDTIKGKLPQKKITTGAANGYSSYGNQIGLATGHVQEIYDPGYMAKRLEIGAVIGAAPRCNIRQEEAEPGDLIILLGGRTGRDGIGGATGSSKSHTEESINVCGAEVQKGNPVPQRNIQKLFMDPNVSCLIKKCNDFGAGGVAVAIGEIAEGLVIYLDTVPKKYEGLDGTELAIAESQERMAVVVDKFDADRFIKAAHAENLEATVVAEVTLEKRLIMEWCGKKIVDISRGFLDTNGAESSTKVRILAPDVNVNPFENDTVEGILDVLGSLNCCCQKGLGEKFDSTIGNGDSYMPYTGRFQLTPSQGMAAKIPVLEGSTDNCTIMTAGFNPKISKWSPFHAAVYSIIEALSKTVAMGGDYKDVYMSFQEYFPKLGDDPIKWGAPTASLIGAYFAQMKLGVAAIGGKDSMSGTFKDIEVPPTLVAFAVSPSEMSKLITSEFKKTGTNVMFVPSSMDDQYMPDFYILKDTLSCLTKDIQEGNILSARAIDFGGIGVAVSKMCFGNKIGVEINLVEQETFGLNYGGFIIEVEHGKSLHSSSAITIGKTVEGESVKFLQGECIPIETLIKAWKKSLENIFPTEVLIPETSNDSNVNVSLYNAKEILKVNSISVKPTVFIPIFPGTNCEIETEKAFTRSGACVKTLVIRNKSASDIKESIAEMARIIKEAQILAFPGGFSAGDEPAGSAKFIATMLNNEYIKEAINYDFLNKTDGLILGICNGFQALIKTGLLPYGQICELDDESPTLTTNEIGRHISCLVDTKIISNLSPWLNDVNLGAIDRIPVSHGEGRFYASKKKIFELIQKGQIATQYVDLDGKASMDIMFNPNGSKYAIEGITSPDGRIFGKMGHSERTGNFHIFEAGVKFFK